MRTLLPTLLREEYRHHTSYSSSRIFHMFPFFVFAFAFAFSLAVPRLSQEMPLWDLLTGGYIGIFLYGLGVGSFAFMGRDRIALHDRAAGTRVVDWHG